jgi:hypothetical protein
VQVALCQIVPGERRESDTKMETTAETVETVAEVLNALEVSINTGYNR